MNVQDTSLPEQFYQFNDLSNCQSTCSVVYATGMTCTKQHFSKYYINSESTLHLSYPGPNGNFCLCDNSQVPIC